MNVINMNLYPGTVFYQVDGQALILGQKMVKVGDEC